MKQPSHHLSNIFFDTLFNLYNKLYVIDLETTGLEPYNDEIIEVALIAYHRTNGFISPYYQLNELIKLHPYTNLPNIITQNHRNNSRTVDFKRKIKGNYFY